MCTRNVKYILEIGHDFPAINGNLTLTPGEQHDLLHEQRKAHWLTCELHYGERIMQFFAASKDQAYKVEIANQSPVYIVTGSGTRVGPLYKLLKKETPDWAK